MNKRFLIAAAILLTAGALTTPWILHAQQINQAAINVTSGPPDATATGNLTDTVGTVTLPMQGYAGAGGTITGVYTGNLDFLVSTDGGTNYVRALVLYQTGFGTGGGNNYKVVDSVSSTNNVAFQFLDLSGVTHVRVQFGTSPTGTATVTLKTTGCAQTSSPSTMWVDNAGGGPQNPRFGLVGGLGTNLTGRALRVADTFKSFDSQAVTSGTPVAIWTPAAGKKFRLTGYHLSLSVAGRVRFIDQSTQFLNTPDLAALIGQPSPPMGNGYLSTAANNALKLDCSASGNISGWVCGNEE